MNCEEICNFGIGIVERNNFIFPFTMSKDCVVVCMNGDEGIHGHADEKVFDPGFKLFERTILVRLVEEVKQEECLSVQQCGAHKVRTVDPVTKA